MSTLHKYHVSSDKLKALHDHIIVKDMNFSERLTENGIIIPHDDGKSAGIRPRWGKVMVVGDEQKDVKAGQYVLVSHGRWTRGITVVLDDCDEETDIRRIDPNDILLVSDEPQYDETLSNAL